MENTIEKILNNKKYVESHIKKTYPELYKEIILFNDGLDISWLNKLYNYIYKIKGKNCEYCGKPLKFKEKMSIGYGKYCSKKCTSRATRVKVKQTNLDKYGVEFPLQNKEILNKVKQTNLDKYGVESTLSNENVKNKIKQTNIEKYGVDNPINSIEIRNKIKQTNLNKYGVENIFENKEVRKKINEKYWNKTNDERKKIFQKMKQTNLNKYGVSTVLSLEENRNKQKRIIREKYGVEFALQNSEIHKKGQETIRKKYEVHNVSQSLIVKENKKSNILIKWAKKLNISINNIEYDNGIFIIKHYCKDHDKFKINYDDLYNRFNMGVINICTKCNPINKQSKIKEKEIASFIDNELNLNYVRNNRKILNGKEIDFYFPEHNLGIEFNGLYYHSNKFTTKNYHLSKTELAEKQNIQLLHIFEDEWIFKRDIIKSIIKSKLNIFDQKYYARKCEIREINDNQLVRKFLNKNHLQGFIGGNIKLGLFYNNELISLMIFGKKRIALGSKSINNNDEFELLRFCNKLNTQVIGGASKLLSFFIKNYKPKLILTFADRRYSNGDLYEKLGFKFIKNTKPNYWYFQKNKLIRYHRFKFRKDILVKNGYNSNKTEKEIMIKNKYYYIYDCGNKKYLLNQ